MWEALQIPGIRAGLSLAVLAVLIATAIQWMKRFRDQSSEDQLDPQEVLGNFAEMRRRGDINEDEFRTIQAAMSDKTRRDLGRSDHKD